MTTLDTLSARRIIEQLGSSGQPPEYGVQYFTAGLDLYLHAVDDEYLSSFIAAGGSAFKLVVGAYGGGKTHFLYCIRNLAGHRNFAVSYVSLKSGGECPFDKLDLVYKAIIGGLLPPISDPNITLEDTKGVENFLRHWYTQRWATYRDQGKSSSAIEEALLEDIDAIAAASIHSISFRNAIVQALRSIMRGEDRRYGEICQWLKGESPVTPHLKQLQITQKVDRTTAFSLIRSLGQVTRQLGYSGLIVLLDEAERVPSLSKGQREQLLSNLREFIDECGHSSFQGIMVFYAVPDQNFLDGRTGVYEALRQRLSTIFDMASPMGVRIELDEAIGNSFSFLCEVGAKIVPIYNTAYGQALQPDQTEPFINSLADSAIKQRFADAGYKRLFVQKLVQGLSVIHRQGRVPTPEELR